MKKMRITIALCCAMFTLSQCVTKPKAPKATPAEESAALKSKYTPDQLAHGRAIMNMNCGKCHELHQPEEYTIHKWDNILPEMSVKAKLSSADAAIVHAFIITNAKDK